MSQSTTTAMNQDRVIANLRRLRERIEQLERQHREPIAIVGVACRLPGGADDLPSLWSMLTGPEDPITTVPPDRWDLSEWYDPDPKVAGKMSTQWGGFLQNVRGFDADFFELTPREVEGMDPQQRLLLESTWRAFEDAGIAVSSRAGSETGVFVGIYNQDYREMQTAQTDAYGATGNANSFAAGRLAYHYDFRGPTMSIDTVCSSSLVALDQACKALHENDCSLAVVAGANLILSPVGTVVASRLLALSADGRCRSFDASGRGFVRSEGVATVLLERLSVAQASGRRIYGVIRGSAVNHDGRSQGITAPNGPAQVAVMRRALEKAGLRAKEVDHVEAHGTGTELGDPIELGALNQVYGEATADTGLCWLGSVKSHIGHVEATAGLAGLLKVLACFHHDKLVRVRHFSKLNPRVSLQGSRLRILANEQPWPRGGRPRIAAVSSFGMSGTNAHVLVAEPPGTTPVVSRPGATLIALSAPTANSLNVYLTNVAQALPMDPHKLHAYCATLSRGRVTYAHRAGVWGSEPHELEQRLRQAAQNEPALGVARGVHDSERRPRCCVLFTGQGSQWVGMGAELYEFDPTFRASIDKCGAIFDQRRQRDLCQLMWNSSAQEIARTSNTQVVVVAIQIALWDMWRAWGLEVDYVLGHSVGEIGAAYASGVLSLRDAVTLACARGEIMDELAGEGAMLSVFSSLDALQMALPAGVELAAENAADEVVVSGEKSAIARFATDLEQRHVRSRPLQVSHAFHSSFMRAGREPLEACARKLVHHEPCIPFVSTIDAKPIHASDFSDGSYWGRQLQAPVRFRSAVEAIDAMGVDVWLEVGPHPVLLGLARRCKASGRAWVGSLRRDRLADLTIVEAASELHVVGVALDFSAVAPHAGLLPVDAPGVPLTRRDYWGAALPGAQAPERLSHLAPEATLEPADVSPTPPRALRAELSTLSAAARQRVLEHELTVIIGRVMKKPAVEIDVDRGLMAMGMDSLMAVEIRESLEQVLELEIPTTLAFDYPDVRSIAGWICTRLGSEDNDPARASDPDVTSALSLSAPIHTNAMLSDAEAEALIQDQFLAIGI